MRALPAGAMQAAACGLIRSLPPSADELRAARRMSAARTDRGLPIGESDKTAICGGNVSKLFGLVAPGRQGRPPPLSSHLENPGE